MFNNSLTGTISSRIGNLRNLEFVFLNGNKFSGSLPTEIEDLSSLSSWHLADNFLEGPVILPDSGSLARVSLDNNKFTGSFPEVKSYNNLEVL